MYLPQVYTCSHPEPPFLHPPHTIPLDHLSTLALNIQYHALNLDWQLVVGMQTSTATMENSVEIP